MTAFYILKRPGSEFHHSPPFRVEDGDSWYSTHMPPRCEERQICLHVSSEGTDEIISLVTNTLGVKRFIFQLMQTTLKKHRVIKTF